MADTETVLEVPETTDGPEPKREQSTISFPYNDLDDAVGIARGVQTVGGSTCETGQLAAQLQMTVTGGGFRLRLLATKLFGLVTYSQGRVALTDLGSKICDPQREAGARVEAFLRVPLYRQLYDKFTNGVLPPNSGLEAEMVAMGVIKKQADKARQVFQRSATQANFFWSGAGRLVRPPQPRATTSEMATPSVGQNGGRAPSDEVTTVEKPRGGGSGGSGGGGDCDPAIHGLIKRLPEPDSDWPLEKQAKWLLAISHAFDVIYPRDNDGRSLRIEIVKD
jgi:hypothetical protein